MGRTPSALRLLIGAALISVPVAAGAEECTRSSGTLSFCKCLYEDALDRIRETQGSDDVSIRKRVEALAKAMKKCMTNGTDEVADEMNRI